MVLPMAMAPWVMVVMSVVYAASAYPAGAAADRGRDGTLRAFRQGGDLEVTIQHELRVEPALAVVIDLLEEDAVEQRADGVARLVHVNREGGRGGPQGGSGGEGQGGDGDGEGAPDRGDDAGAAAVAHPRTTMLTRRPPPASWRASSSSSR